MKIFFTAISLLLIFTTVNDIAMLSVKIGSPEADLKKIKLKEVASEEGIKKYSTENGNDFSVTVKEGKVIFMENDWLQDPNATETLLPGFIFGSTSLKQIRQKFGTNGFTHVNASNTKTDTHLIMLNCFEFDSANNEILVVITKVPLNADVNEQNVAEQLKLDALIIADKNYLEEIWGSEKLFDKNYKKIKL